jgi:GT2 family glycosyltransferase
VKIITELLQKGPNHARQKGAEVATGDILAFIDADTKMPENWINILIDEFNKNPKLVALSGPFVYYDFSKWQKFLSSIYWYILAYPLYLLVGYMAVAGNFVIRKDIFDKMNGLDTSIVFYGDDTNTARRASRFGKVKFRLDFFLYSSARRLIKQNMLKVTFVYVVNFFSQTFMKKSVHHSYEEIR